MKSSVTIDVSVLLTHMVFLIVGADSYCEMNSIAADGVCLVYLFYLTMV
jgi:hypothetical protein